jgi:uncharacterized membrane protein YedE/YeeE
VDPLGTTLGILIAVVLVLVAGYFIHRQRLTLQSLRADTNMPTEQRRYLYKQSWRRMFGAVLLILLGAMMLGSVFLDYEPQPGEGGVDKEAAKQAVRFLSFYLMTMLLVLMVILSLAVLDFWAIARFSVYQQKQLIQEHHAMLEADLLEYKHRQSESNGTM